MNSRSLQTSPENASGSRFSAPIWLMIAVAIACGLAAPLLVEQMTHPPSGARLTYLVIAAAAGAAILVEFSVHGLVGLFSPMSATMAGFLWFFCAGPIFKPEMNRELYARAASYIPLAAMISLGFVSFVIGYATAPRIRLEWLVSWLDRLNRRLTPSRLLLLQVALLLILMSLLVVTAGLIGVHPLRFFTDSMYGIETAPQLAIRHPIARYPYQLHRSVLIALCCASALLLSWRGVGRTGRASALIGLAATTVLAAARGSRFIMLYATGGGLLLLLIRALSSSRRIPRQVSWRRAAAAFLALLTLGFAGLQLVELRRGGSPFEKLTEGRLAGLTEVIDYGADMNRTLNTSLELIPDEQPYLLGKTYLSAFTLFIPRALWPEKPAPLSNYLFRASGSTVQNVSFSNVGEFYANFGLLGVVVGMWLTGVILSACWRVFLEHRRNPLMVLFYALLPFTAAFMVRGDFSTAFGAALYSGIVLWAGLWLVTRRRR